MEAPLRREKRLILAGGLKLASFPSILTRPTPPAEGSAGGVERVEKGCAAGLLPPFVQREGLCFAFPHRAARYAHTKS